MSFRQEFADLVESGKKTQTIRAHRKDGRDPKPGDTLYLYTGMRTKSCRKLGEATCTEVVPIEIRRDDVKVDPAFVVRAGGFNGIALADGFDTWRDLSAWFKRVHELPFRGLVIRWWLP